jgi:hypothetical protein
MAEKELVFKVKVVNESGEVIEKTATSFKDLNESVSSLKTELDKTDLGSEKFKQLQGELKKSEAALDEAKTSTQSLGESFTQIPGPIGQVAQGVKGLNTAFKLLIANPIGLTITAIVVALTTLYKAFTSTKAGGEQLDRIMAGLSAVFDVLRDRVLKVGGALVKFLTGDFAGAAEDIKGAYSGLGEEIAGEFQEAAKLKGELQAIDDATRELNNTRAEQNKLIADSKLKINDENLSYAERQKALDEVRKAEISLAKQEEELARRRFEAIKAQNALSDSSKEALDQEAQAYQALQQAQQISLQKQKELFDQQKALRDRERAEAKAAADKRKQEQEAALAFTQKVNLDALDSEFERARQTVELDKQAQLETLKTLKLTLEEKEALRVKIEETTAEKLAAINEAEQKKADDDRQTELEKIKADNEAKRQIEITNTEAEIELALMRDEKDLELLQNKLTKRLELELENENLTEAQRVLIKEQYAEKLKLIEKDITDAKKQEVRDRINADIAEVQSAANTAADLANIFGQETEAGKAAALAAALLNTYAGAAKALNDETIPNTFARIVAAAAVVVAGLRQVRQITSTKTTIPGKAAGGFITGVGSGTSDNIPMMLSNGEFVMNAASTRMFAPVLESMNLLGQNLSTARGVDNASVDGAQQAIISSLGSQGSNPIRAYVLTNDVDTSTAFDRQVKTRSTL